jgi:hypothetical protein
MNMPGMGAAADVAGVSASMVLLRIVLLLATAVIAGIGSLGPAVRAICARAFVVTWISAAVAAAAAVVSVWAVNASPPFVVVQLVLTAVVPLTLRRFPTVAVLAGLLLAGVLVAESAPGHSGLFFLVDLLYTGAAVVWLGMTVFAATVTNDDWIVDRRRARLIALSASALLAVSGVVQLVGSGIAFDRRIFQSAYGITLLVAAVASVAVFAATVVVLRERTPSHAYRLGVIGVTAGFLMWGASTAFPAPGPLPTPGVPELAEVSVAGKQLPTLVTPQRPGRNLVHFPASAGTGLSVAAGGASVRAMPRPGAEGTWAEVQLPAGRSELTVRSKGSQGALDVDAGTAHGPASASGADGPECSSAALGTLAAGRRVELNACPSDALDAQDAEALRGTVGFLVSRHAKEIQVVGDESRRSKQAETVVRTASAGKIKLISEPRHNSALLVLSGWDKGSVQLRSAFGALANGSAYLYGFYLAPWLLNAPVVNSVPSASVPLRFDPRVPDSLEFSTTLEHSFGDENPSTSAYYAWRRAKQLPIDTRAQIYATAQVDAMPMSGMRMGAPYPGQWVPNGTVVPVSGLL